MKHFLVLALGLAASLEAATTNVYFIASPADLKARIADQLHITKPDFVVFVPEAAADVSDTGNEHFLVFDGPDSSLMSVWTQSSVENFSTNTPPDQHIVYARSADEGKTWSKPRIIAGPKRAGDGYMASWAYPLVSKRGRVYVLYSQSIGITDCFVHHTGWLHGIYSDDNGATWSKPQNIPVARSINDNPDLTMPPNMLCWQKPLRLGKDGKYFAGFTRWTSFAVKKPSPKSLGTADSRVEFMRFENVDESPEPCDLKISWFMSNEKALAVPCTSFPENSVCQEPSIVKLPDGRLFCVMRTSAGSPFWSVSSDAGETWTEPRRLLRKDNGEPLRHPVSPCPIYDVGGNEAGSGRYVLFIHDNDGKFTGYRPKPTVTGFNRRPLYLVAGRYHAGADQPVWFDDLQFIMDHDNTSLGKVGTNGRFDLSLYASFTCRKGVPVLWYPERKFFLLGRVIGEEWFAPSSRAAASRDLAGAQAATNAPVVMSADKALVKIKLVKVNDRDQPHALRYFGNWNWNTYANPGFYLNDSSASDRQFSTCWLTFAGSVIKVFGSKGENHGLADIYLDGELAQTIDSYSPTFMTNALLFERIGLRNSQHVLTLVVRKERNKHAVGCVTEIDYFECEKPMNISAVMKQECELEYDVIFADKKPQPDPSKWRPVQDVIHEPVGGVTLKPGVLNDVFERNIAYLNYSFSFPLHINPTPGRGGPLGWSKELPAASDGRLLAGAAGSLRWGEREDMRKIVKTILDKIAKQLRSDGYHNYYPEAESFASNLRDWATERKNFDRKFWTQGLLAAGLAGYPEAYQIVRRFYDWFNASPYPRDILNGKNAEEALDVWQQVYNSPVGKTEDLVHAIRYCDQAYWIRVLGNQNPFAFSDYPGNRPQGADLLGLSGFLANYKATGDQKYLKAVTGGWSVFKKYNLHNGGTSAICENNYYPPLSQFLNQHTGETCPSIFWANLSAALMRLLLDEKYSAEVENVLYNVVMASQDSNGLIRYHNNLENVKDIPTCKNLCCETSLSGFIGNLPALIYSTAADGLYVHLFAASTINWKVNGKNVVVETETRFPYASGVLVTVKEAEDAPMKIRIRVPSWATGRMPVKVNGEQFTVGTPGSYVTLDRNWRSNDKIEFNLPIGFRTVQYTGLEQVEGNLDRYALFWGPILMALEAPVNGIPRITASADKLSEMLTPVGGQPLHYSVQGHPGVQYLPYWQVTNQTFTCFPIVQP